MSTHTKGPWFVTPKFEIGPMSNEDDQSYGFVIPVADAWGPNRVADAHLIAEAPVMYEFIKNRAACGDTEAQEFIAALAKAEGSTS